MRIFSRHPFSDRANIGGGLKAIAGRPESRWAGLGLLLVMLVFVGWLGYGAMHAKSSLEQSRAYAEQAKDALLSGKSEDATRYAENAQFHARQARSATHSLPWNIAAAVPLVGSPLKTTQQISDVVVGLVDDVLLPAAGMGAGLSPDKLIDGTRLDLKLLRSEQPRLSELSAAAADLNASAQAISEPAYLSLIGNARSQLQDQTSGLAQLLKNTALAAQLAPSMLGADGPRTYLMVFQTPAEARGTGGLLGGIAVLRFANGVPTVDTVRTNYELLKATAAVDLGQEFDQAYGWMNPLTDFRNSNMSPHFPYAAQIWKSMWENKIAGGGPGQPVDGVIALDPIALSYLLVAAGPISMPDGEVVNEENLVELTMSSAYLRFADVNQFERKMYLQDIGSGIVDKLAKGPLPPPRTLLDALGRAASEGRIAVWSSSPADQKLLAQTPLAHVLPEDEAPYAQVVINNLAGNKMDYYLTREIEYAADNCKGERRNSTITVRLTNTATDKSLPFTVGGASGFSDGLPLKVPNGTMVTSVKVIATKGSTLLGVTSNGERTSAITHFERGHPSFEVQVVIPPGQSGELTFRLSEPTSAGVARMPIQPLVDDVSPVVKVPVCSQ